MDLKICDHKSADKLECYQCYKDGCADCFFIWYANANSPAKCNACMEKFENKSLYQDLNDIDEQYRLERMIIYAKEIKDLINILLLEPTDGNLNKIKKIITWIASVSENLKNEFI